MNLLDAEANVTEFSLSCILMGKDGEMNCVICLNAKKSIKGECVCVF